ncbi:MULTISPECIES: nucleotide-binding protein [unclassified Luteibacter]|uniref:nucleotide-binding protein n=1 Tax=Luteibacter sp. PvP019 TaxID=3156436 RepID=UPI003399437C
MYSLIVSGVDERWNSSPVEFPLERYITQYTSADLVARFKMTSAIADELRGIPAIFAYEIGAGSEARVGWINNVKFSAKTIRIEFVFEASIPAIELKAFYNACEHFGIEKEEARRTHWAIKDVDLANALELAGFISSNQSLALTLPRWLTANLKTPIRPANQTADGPKISLVDLISPATVNLAPPPTEVRAPVTPLADGVSQALHPVLPRGDGSITGVQPKVFVVHGRDKSLQGDVLLYLTRIGIDPIVLHEQANGGRTILEKFEEEAACASYAIVLMTPDDIGGLVGGESKLRARQNVVLELGYFIGKLGKKRVCVMRLGEIEDPSDFSGVAYIGVGSNDWKRQLLRELDKAGISFDPLRASLM